MSGTPVDEPVGAPGTLSYEEPPKIKITRRSALVLGIFILCVVVFLYFGLPKLAGIGETWSRLRHGDPWWLAVAVLFEVCSFLGYVWLFRTVFVRGDTKIDWRSSYQITMAGVAATRLFAAGGAGGIALTAWALRRAGMERRTVACRMVAFNVLLYTVYALGMVIGGFGLYLGLFNGDGSFAITMVPAIFGAVAFVVAYTTALVPQDVERRLAGWSAGHGRGSRLLARLAAAPASVASGVRTAVQIVRDREPGTIGAVIWWGFDIATLWACFHAFGANPPPIVVIMLAYLVGMLGNLLPLPGGVGGVDGGMIGAFAAFDVEFGYATVAVLAYRGFAFWLPTIPGVLAYLQLRRTVAGWQREGRGSTTETAAA
jgi:uncharacterized protein (TIRG00374 family)